MSDTPSLKGLNGKSITPLVIILSFVVLVEIAITTGIVMTSGPVQVILATFVALFPIIIVAPFFYLLSTKPWVFYAPKDYGDSVDPSQFLDAMKRINMTSIKIIEEIPKEIEKATAVASGDTYPAGKTNSEVAKIIGKKIADEVAKRTSIRIDITDFGGAKPTIPFNENFPVGEFLDLIYFKINEHYELVPFTYDSKWVLRDVDTGKVFGNMGRRWATENGLAMDTRPLHEVGIVAGSRLKAVKL